jgi:hypothetical protein
LPITRVFRGNRELYRVGSDYAAQPGRGKKAVARVRITAIERYDVRTITAAQAHAEGFKSPLDFLALWVQMHDNPHGLFEAPNGSDVAWSLDSDTLGYWEGKSCAEIMGKLKDRPAAKYDAWLLAFEPVEVK